MSHRGVWYRLLFTKDDDLDLTQVYFGVAVVVFLVAFLLAGLGVLRVTTAAWAAFGGVFATLAIAGTSHVVSQRLAASRAPAALAAGIAEAAEPSLWRDDETGGDARRDYRGTAV